MTGCGSDNLWLSKIAEGQDLEDLLEAVEEALTQEIDQVSHGHWNLRRVYGGMNGITYHAENSLVVGNSLAVKIRKRDERKRALREFSALQALRQLSKPVAPDPISIYSNLAYLPGDVVITSWVEGHVLGDLGDAPHAIWESILNALSRIHSLQPVHAPHLIDAVWPIRSSRDVIEEIEKRYARLPEGQLGEITKAGIGELFTEVKTRLVKSIQPVQHVGLILCDTNPSNMIECDGHILIVDWENSGWADTAFDIADLLVRPECANLSSDMRNWILVRYAELMESPYINERILTYEHLMLIFWLILTTNGFTSGPVQRFAGSRSFTLEETRHQQISYLERIARARSY